MQSKPLAYFITYTTYGSWLHGDSRNSALVRDGIPRMIGPSARLLHYERRLLKHAGIAFDGNQRQIVRDTIIRHCELKQWCLLALHVRVNHVHVLVQSPASAEKVMVDLKAYATRRLRQAGYKLQKVWTKHGSTQYVFTYPKLYEKARYIIHEQGRPMAYYVDHRLKDKL